VAENTQGVVYMAKASAGTFSIDGADAAAFVINANTGDLSFKVAPDFEKPTDVGQNNVYNLNVKATANGLVGELTLTVTVTDESLPALSVVFPTEGANLGGDIGQAAQLTFVAKLVDAENADKPLVAESVTLDGEPMVKDALTGLWTLDVTLPGNGLFTKTASASYKTKMYSAVRNIRNEPVVKPVSLGLNLFALNDENKLTPKLFMYSAGSGTLFSMVIETGRLSAIFTDKSANPELIETEEGQANPYGYSVVPRSSNSVSATSRWLARAKPGGTAFVYGNTAGTAGAVTNVSALVIDENNNRLPNDDRALLLGREDGTGKSYVASIDVSNKSLTPPALTTAPARIWEQSTGTTSPVTMGYDAVTKTLLIADDRGATSKIQGFTLVAGNTTGTRKFEADVGPYVQRIVVDAAAGFAYVLEGRSYLAPFKIARINTTSGAVQYIYDETQGTGNKFGAIADIRVDSVGKKLYVADSLNNSIHTIDTQTLAQALVRSFAVGTGTGIEPSDVAFDGSKTLFVADAGRGGLVDVDKTTGNRVLLRKPTRLGSAWSVPQLLSYDDRVGVLSVERVFAPNWIVGAPADKSLIATDILSKTAEVVVANGAGFKSDHAQIYTYQGDKYAIVNDGNKVNAVNLTSGQIVSVINDTSLGIEANAVTAVTISANNGRNILYAFNNATKTLLSLNTDLAGAKLETVVTYDKVNRPTDIGVDGNMIYWVDSGTFYKMDITDKQVKVLSLLSSSTENYPTGARSASGVDTLGDKFEIDSKNQVAWFASRNYGALVAVSLITGDRVVVSH
jgi:DNA-binding beta-propeller fold protein YncE